MEDLLRDLAAGWIKKVQLGLKHKRPFSEDAREAMDFFDGPHNWFWREQYAKGDQGYNRSISPPGFRMQVNRVFEAVKLFASVIYHRNPVRTVTSSEYPVVPPEAVGAHTSPEVAQQYQMAVQATIEMDGNRKLAADLLQRVLNYTPNELDLKTHSRRVVDEAIIKGAGVWWTELVTDEGSGRRMIGSFADTIDNLVLDPDATEIEDILWCARRCVHPIDVVARQYGLEREQLQGNLEGQNRPRGDQNADGATRFDEHGRSTARQVGKTNDLVTYWKIWSKTGMGDRLKDADPERRGMFDQHGDNCYLVVAEGVDFPLNLPPSMFEQPEAAEGIPEPEPPDLFSVTQWPIPYWAESNGWPFTMLAFHRKPGYVWPISHIKPGIPELRFLCWAFSFLAQRVATSCETLIGVSKAADQDIKDQILSQSEAGFKIVELSEMLGRSVNDVISVFQLPNVTSEIWGVIEAVTNMLDKRLGMTELIYGLTTSQMRSATEASVKSEQISVRPDDMAEVLENSMSILARREALACRWLLDSNDVAPILGPLGAYAWEQTVASMEPFEVAREYDYRVEAGSARKPNKATRIEQMQAAVQTLGPVLSGLIGAGVVEPFNALVSDWAESMDIDATPYLIPPPPPPPEMPGPPGGPPPEEPPAEAPQAPEEAPAPPPAGPPPVPPQVPAEIQ
jgi:hypothetical protein